MKSIIINGHIGSSGEVVVTNSIAEDENGKKFLLTTGTLKSLDYFEEVESIETENFSIFEVYVYGETFSTESKEITYHFQSKKFIRANSGGEE